MTIGVTVTSPAVIALADQLTKPIFDVKLTMVKPLILLFVWLSGGILGMWIAMIVQRRKTMREIERAMLTNIENGADHGNNN